MGPFWLTGGGFGLDGSWLAFVVLLAAAAVRVPATRDLDFHYNAPEIVPGGIPVDIDAAAAGSTKPRWGRPRRRPRCAGSGRRFRPLPRCARRRSGPSGARTIRQRIRLGDDSQEVQWLPIRQPACWKRLPGRFKSNLTFVLAFGLLSAQCWMYPCEAP